jgi:hypothetical protein
MELCVSQGYIALPKVFETKEKISLQRKLQIKQYKVSQYILFTTSR